MFSGTADLSSNCVTSFSLRSARRTSRSSLLALIFLFLATEAYSHIYTNLATLTLEIGRFPTWWLVQGEDGAFDGVATDGGTNHDGSAYRVTSDGALTAIYFFTGSPTDASAPYGLTSGAEGILYGV